VSTLSMFLTNLHVLDEPATANTQSLITPSQLTLNKVTRNALSRKKRALISDLDAVFGRNWRSTRTFTAQDPNFIALHTFLDLMLRRPGKAQGQN